MEPRGMRACEAVQILRGRSLTIGRHTFRGANHGCRHCFVFIFMNELEMSYHFIEHTFSTNLT